MPEEIADPDKSGGPHHRRKEVQAQKPLPPNRADPERERREIPDAVNKAERKNEPDVVPLEPGQRALNTRAPARKTLEQSHAISSTQPEVALIAEIAAEPCRGQQQPRI